LAGLRGSNEVLSNPRLGGVPTVYPPKKRVTHRFAGLRQATIDREAPKGTVKALIYFEGNFFSTPNAIIASSSLG